MEFRKFFSKKYFFLTILGLLFILAGCRAQDRSSTSELKKVFIKNQYFLVEIADSPNEQKIGLSERANLPLNTGMLFVFPDKKNRSFWMKKMKFPIDIIWIKDNEIVKIDKNLTPEGDLPESTYTSNSLVDLVLEINGGLSDKYKFKIGDKVAIE